MQRYPSMRYCGSRRSNTEREPPAEKAMPFAAQTVKVTTFRYCNSLKPSSVFY